MARPAASTIVAVTLPLLLAVAVGVIAIVVRALAPDAQAPADTKPLALAPVEAPEADGSRCAALLAALPAELPGSGGTLPTRTLADPVPAGARAWAAAPRPVVLRCGLPRPVELTPTSALVEVDGVRWLELDDGVPDPVLLTYIAVDRPVYVALTAPVAAGSGPLQAISDTIRDTLPVTDVAVR